MKNGLWFCLLISAFAPLAAHAEEVSSHSLTGNVSIVSDYRFRGVSQSYKQPAIQGGIDYSHSSGLYLGNWNSSVSGNSYNDGAGLEMDFYGGWKPTAGDFTFDIGALQYYYPGAEIRGTTEKYNTLEAYLGAAYGPLGFKAWYALTDWFGINKDSGYQDSDGSIYYDLSGTFPIADKLSLNAHVGYQSVRRNSDFDYFDYKLGLSYDYRSWLLGAALVGTDADEDIYFASRANGSGSKDTGKATVVLSVSKTF
jgi:uncharacterized protein (TIGR02001 family)